MDLLEHWEEPQRAVKVESEDWPEQNDPPPYWIPLTTLQGPVTPEHSLNGIEYGPA
jgi:hypothetical protein